ncbi:hypothetical protein PM082_024473 [Marasmius tenuissimus]|nr:hypothetical protein PM082_024473 [Marasmius tenuissimus]
MALYLALIALLGSQNHCRIILNLLSPAAHETANAKRPETDEVNGLLKHVLKARLELAEDDALIPDARAVVTSAVFDNEPSYVYPFSHVSNVLTKVTAILSLANASPTISCPQLAIPNTLTTSHYHARLWDSTINLSSPTLGPTTGRITPVEPPGKDTIPPVNPKLESEGGIYDGDSVAPSKLPVGDLIPLVDSNLKLNGGIIERGTLTALLEFLISVSGVWVLTAQSP